jgi:hypothetical protein
VTEGLVERQGHGDALFDEGGRFEGLVQRGLRARWGTSSAICSSRLAASGSLRGDRHDRRCVDHNQRGQSTLVIAKNECPLASGPRGLALLPSAGGSRLGLWRWRRWWRCGVVLGVAGPGCGRCRGLASATDAPEDEIVASSILLPDEGAQETRS